MSSATSTEVGVPVSRTQSREWSSHRVVSRGRGEPTVFPDTRERRKLSRSRVGILLDRVSPTSLSDPGEYDFQSYLVSPVGPNLDTLEVVPCTGETRNMTLGFREDLDGESQSTTDTYIHRRSYGSRH